MAPGSSTRRPSSTLARNDIDTSAHRTPTRATPGSPSGSIWAFGFRNRPTVFLSTGGTGIQAAFPPTNSTRSARHSTKARRSAGRYDGRAGGPSGTPETLEVDDLRGEPRTEPLTRSFVVAQPRSVLNQSPAPAA